MIKMLQVKYGQEVTSTLRNHKHARIETSTTRRWFNCSSTSFWITGWWVVVALTLNCQNLQNKGGWDQSWRWWLPNHIKHKPVICNASPLIKKFEKHTNLKNCRCRWWGGWGPWHIRSATSMDPFPPSFSRTSGDIATSRLLATWTSLIPTLYARPLSQGGTTRPWHWSLLHHEMEPRLWPGLATLLGGKDWDKPIEDCCWACARHQLIWPYRQASLGGITSLRLWRKGNCEAQTSQHYLETELNTYTKIWAEFPTHLETALSKMLSNLRSNSHTSDTGIMLLSELSSEERVSRRATLRWEMSCSVSRVVWTTVPTPVCKSDTDWSAFLLEDKVMLSSGVDDQNLKAAG